MKRVTERLREKEFRHPPVGRASESSSNPASEERAAVVVADSDKHRESPVNSNRQRLMADRAKRMSRSIPNLATKVQEDDDVRCTGEGSSATGSNDENKIHDKRAKPKTRYALLHRTIDYFNVTFVYLMYFTLLSVPDIKPKTFYFGMNEFNDTTKTSRTSEDVDRFAESFNKTNASPSDSIASSDPTDEVYTNKVGFISVIIIFTRNIILIFSNVV